MESVRDVSSSHAVLDSEREFVDDLTGMWSDNGRAEQDAALVGDDFAETVAEIIGIAAADDIERGNCSLDREVTLQAGGFREADACDFRSHESYAWNGFVIW